MTLRYLIDKPYRGSAISQTTIDRAKQTDWFPMHYVVSLIQRPDRRTKMIRKMTHAGLPYRLVDALTPADEVVRNHYGFKCHFDRRWGCNGSRVGPVIACMASHFKALREFVASDEDMAVVFEDDVILRIDYKERLRQLIEKFIDKPAFPNVIMLSPGLDPNTDELYPNTHVTWGALGYMITRSYAIHVLATYDKRFIDLWMILRNDGIRTILDKFGASAELIPMKSGGLVCSIPLVIEQPNEVSNLGNSIGFHASMFSKFGYSNYVMDYP